MFQFAIEAYRHLDRNNVPIAYKNLYWPIDVFCKEYILLISTMYDFKIPVSFFSRLSTQKLNHIFQAHNMMTSDQVPTSNSTYNCREPP